MVHTEDTVGGRFGYSFFLTILGTDFVIITARLSAKKRPAA